MASPNGRDWQPIGRWPGIPSGWNRAVETADGLVAVGLGEERDWLAVWHSPDGADWTELHREEGPWAVEALAVDLRRIAVAGFVPVDEQADEDAPTTLTTVDGTTWSQSRGDQLPTTRFPMDIAINGDVAVMLTEPRPGEPAVWRAELR